MNVIYYKDNLEARPSPGSGSALKSMKINYNWYTVTLKM